MKPLLTDPLCNTKMMIGTQSEEVGVTVPLMMVMTMMMMRMVMVMRMITTHSPGGGGGGLKNCLRLASSCRF